MVGTEEQIAEGAAQQVGDPPLCQVVRPVVDHVASLAKAFQVARPIVGRVMVEVRCGEHDTGVRAGRPSMSGGGPAAPAIAPGARGGSNQRPSGKQRMVSPCGRPQLSHRPPARSNRTCRLIFQSGG